MTRRCEPGQRPPPSHPESLTALVLAGGGSRRMGRDKLSLERGGQTLLSVVVAGVDAAFASGGHRPNIVVVGPQRQHLAHGRWVCEEPPGGGPVAGIAAGLNEVSTPWVALLAGDAPHGPRALPVLWSVAGSLGADIDGVCVQGSDGRTQPLCGIYRRGQLREAVGSLDAVAGAAVRSLFGHLRIITVADQWAAADDIDEPADAQRAGFDWVDRG
ncbi:MAG: molybdenum cofactor guanylyltransferase [Candidatus Nanopelagicales bacterium]|nr:molybdenum cofactor guanylyltransferase [Candidatus Nanopelagicales bacterium]MDP4825354.1 molybdenum cofactor guanylyltransferase [Candidatus Nanopelagicales bacterium]MDP4887646.1 molybdenum cofactor guanylyltransferase [Candidatus Nanopelagicales bacterium]